eukprot:gene10716-12465_t
MKLGLATAPVLYAAEEYPQLINLIQRNFSHKGDIDEANRLVSASNGVKKTQCLAISYCNLAIESLLQLPPILVDRDAEIAAFEQQKAAANKPMEQCHTLVKNTLGQLEKIDDLSDYWIKANPITLMPFLPSDNSNDNGGGSSTSDEVLLYLNSDLSKLLKMRYNVFWSNILMNRSILDFIDTFLRFVTRPYTPIDLCGGSGGKSSKDFIESKRTLVHRVFSVIVRMSMQQEKSGQHISRDFYAKNVVAKLFDVPRLIDIASIYAPRCKDAVTDLVQRIFDIAPKIYDAFKPYVSAISRTLLDLNLSIIQTNHLDLIRIEDSSRLLLDIVYSLDCMLRVYPMASHPFIEDEHFVSLMVYYYQIVLPVFGQASPSQYRLTFRPIADHIVGILHSITKHNFVNKIDQLTQSLSDPCLHCPKSRGTISQLSTRFLEFLGRLVAHNEFDKEKRTRSFTELYEQIPGVSLLYDYEGKSNLSSRLIQLAQNDSEIDIVNLKYYLTYQQQELTPGDKANIASVKEIFGDLGEGFVNSSVDTISTQFLEMTVGKRSVELPANLMNNVKNYIANYEVMYDDEYDDSMDVFLGVSVQDGESLDNEEEEQKKQQQHHENSSLQKKPSTTTGGFNKGPANKKSHSRRDAANKKRGMVSEK